MKIMLIGGVFHPWPSKWGWRAIYTFLVSTTNDDYYINSKSHCVAKPFCIVLDAIAHMAYDSCEQYPAYSGMLSLISHIQHSPGYIANVAFMYCDGA